MSEHRITYVTTPIEVGEQIATTLVQEDLAVCVNIVERVRSIYKWESKVEKSAESLLVIKAVTEKTDAIIERVRQIHPYEVPEVISFDITAGNKDYLDWLSGKEIRVEEDVLLGEDEIELDEDEEAEAEAEEELEEEKS